MALGSLAPSPRALPCLAGARRERVERAEPRRVYALLAGDANCGNGALSNSRERLKSGEFENLKDVRKIYFDAGCLELIASLLLAHTREMRK